MSLPNGYAISGLGFCPENYPLSEHTGMKIQLVE
jgi:hypothetical protein